MQDSCSYPSLVLAAAADAAVVADFEIAAAVAVDAVGAVDVELVEPATERG